MAVNRRRSFFAPDKKDKKPATFPVGGEAEIQKRGGSYYVVSSMFGYDSVLARFPASDQSKKVNKGLRAAYSWAKKNSIKITKVTEMKAEALIEAMIENDRSAADVLDEAIVPVWYNQRWGQTGYSIRRPWLKDEYESVPTRESLDEMKMTVKKDGTTHWDPNADGRMAYFQPNALTGPMLTLRDPKKSMSYRLPSKERPNKVVRSWMTKGILPKLPSA